MSPSRAEVDADADARGATGSARLWALVGATLGALLATGWLTVRALEAGPRPSFATGRADPAHAVRGAPPIAAHDALDLAGSGSNVPLARALAKAFSEQRPGKRVVVHESIGSTGGARATRDGQVDLGLVSRELTREEQRFGLVVVPHARVAVVLAAHPGVPTSDVRAAELVKLYAGARKRWSDGAPVVVLQRERGDSSHLAVSQLVPGFADANDGAYRAGRWRVLYHDSTMQEALMSTDGAVGLFDLGQIVTQNLPLRVLTIDGIEPSADNVRSGRYPFAKDLAFVSLGEPHGLAAELVAFARSPEGRAITLRSGYVPLPLDEDAGAPP
jgi:phosphate transport system substrate-binding protein